MQRVFNRACAQCPAARCIRVVHSPTRESDDPSTGEPQCRQCHVRARHGRLWPCHRTAGAQRAYVPHHARTAHSSSLQPQTQDGCCSTGQPADLGFMDLTQLRGIAEPRPTFTITQQRHSRRWSTTTSPSSCAWPDSGRHRTCRRSFRRTDLSSIGDS